MTLTTLLLAACSVTQVFLEPRYTRGDTNQRSQQPIDEASWVWADEPTIWGVSADADAWTYTSTVDDPRAFKRFRRVFSAVADTPLRLHVSADERFVLFLDGREIARGPQRGMVDHWYYQTYEIADLAAGEHTLEAVVWVLGRNAPLAQVSYRGGFILKAEGAYDKQLTTGRVTWQVGTLAGTRPNGAKKGGTFGTGGQFSVTGTGCLDEMPASWQNVIVIRPEIPNNAYGALSKGWKLFPVARPDQMHELKTPGQVVNASVDLTKPFTVPPHTSLDYYWDLDDYYCAYPELDVSGGRGAVVTWGWAESMRDPVKTGSCALDATRRLVKGNRNEWKGKIFGSVPTETFICDGRPFARFTSPWWRCGRWCRLTIETADEPLEVKRVQIAETRYPFVLDFDFACDDPSVDPIVKICRRGIEMCSHEMLFDCPYYEQQMYPGDTRIQLQVINTLTRDPRLTRFALSIYDWNRRSDGFIDMNFPTRGTQESPTYTMCWIMMFRDYLYWHGDLDFLRLRMPGVRNALMGLALYENADGFVENLPGWSFMDWVGGDKVNFVDGVAPCGKYGQGVSALNNLQYLLALQSAAAVDAALGEGHFADHWREKAKKLGRAIVASFWDANRGALADTLDHTRFSEHAQAMAILADILPADKRAQAVNTLVRGGDDLSPASSYFAYYLFDALARGGRADVIRERFAYWNKFVAWGARTSFETQDQETRSDCHGWSAAPLYFLQTCFAGVQPAEPGFKSVRIAPQPAGLKVIRAKTPCPQGVIETDFSFGEDGSVKGSIILPPGLGGTFEWQGARSPLVPGKNTL